MMLVDSENVASWVAGRSSAARATSEARAEVERLLTQTEDLLMVGAFRCEWTELMVWIPRELNKAADKLAGAAREERRTRRWMSAKIGQKCNAAMLCYSDASAAQDDGWAGLGSIGVSKQTGQLLWAIQEAVELGGRPPDINALEAQAAATSLHMVAVVAWGTWKPMQHGWQRTGGAFTDAEKRTIMKLARGSTCATAAVASLGPAGTPGRTRKRARREEEPSRTVQRGH